MRPLTIILLVVALGIAGSAAFLAKRMLDNRQEVAQPVTPTVDVLVANRDMQVGSMVTQDALRWEPWPEGSVDGRLVVRTQGKDPMQAFVGAFARKEVISGEPMRASYVFRQGEARVMAGLLTPGMRAMAVRITAESAAAGFIRPGDHVDVVVTYKVDTGKGKDNTNAKVYKNASETLLRDIRVLAIDQAIKVGEDPAKTGKTATMEVTLTQAETLALAQDMGDISLVLRSLAPGALDDDPMGPTFTSDLMIARGMAQAVLGRAFDQPDQNMQFDMPKSESVPVVTRAPQPKAAQPAPRPKKKTVINVYNGGSRSQKAF